MKTYIWNEEVFEKVKSGEWTFEQFEDWEASRYNDGYKDGREDADNDRSGE